jgi:beta-galactosidase/beta-glucuronidase
VPKDTRLTVALEFGDLALASCDVAASGTSTEITLSIARQQNGQALEELLWSPEHPTLIDATVRLIVPQQDDDVVASYLGLRSASVGGGRFLLNDRPYFVRSVLNQGYWPESHAAAPSSTALRDETRLIKDLGFNATRIHQKYEDPRFLFWADKLGLLVWEEAPSAYAFTAVAIQRTTTEWIAILDRDRSHPCIVTWVPLNESWGVPHIAQDPQMRSYARGLVNLTKAIDPTRPVISNDGWEHVESDILSIHDYDADINRLRERFASAAQILDAEFGHAGRRLIVDDAQDRHAPIMLTEFGGISYTEKTIEASWGYSTATSVENFAERLRPLFAVVNDRPVLAGYCYTQLADTGQETNGLVFEDRRPKIPLQELRRIVSGEDSLPRPGLPSQLRRDELLD